MPIQSSEARERVLRAAERLFTERGYEAVTIKDIATAVGIHHASLYHHIPGGKEPLYVEVMERCLLRHRDGIHTAVDAAVGDLRGQLHNIAAWLLSHPPLDLIRMVNSDLPALTQPGAAEKLSDLAYEVLFVPIVAALEASQAGGEIAHNNIGNIAGGIMSALEGLHALPDEYVETSRLDMADELIEVFLRGMKPG